MYSKRELSDATAMVARPLRRNGGTPTMEQTMTRALPTLLCLAILAPAAAVAAPAAGAPRLQVVSGDGLVARRPMTSQLVEGLRVQGAICRAAPQLATGIAGVRIERLDAAGVVISKVSTQFHNALGPHDRTCGFYDVHTAWTLGSQETLRVCATVSGVSACGAGGGAD